MVIKQDIAFSGLDSAARQQTLSRIRDLQKAKTGDSFAQRHVEFKQLASQSKGDVGLFEVILHHTVARTEGEEVEVGENEKENDQFLECPPCDEGGEIKRALRWSSEPLATYCHCDADDTKAIWVSCVKLSKWLPLGPNRPPRP